MKAIQEYLQTRGFWGLENDQESWIWVQLYIVKGTASLEVKSSKWNRELENVVSLEPRVCEVLLYTEGQINVMVKTVSKDGKIPYL